MPLACYFSPAYSPENASTFATLAATAKALESFDSIQLIAPQPIDYNCLRDLHSDEYLNAFLNGKNPLASSQGIAWTPDIRDASLAMLGGQIEGTKYALKNGIAMNLARGFHHAVRERGSGYCALNGLALVAHHFPNLRVVVLDCDEHGGNGTEEFAAELPNLFNISIFGTRFGCLGGVRSWALQVLAKDQGFDIYMSALRAAEDLISELRPDILLYQAGTDCHQFDPKNRSGLTTEELHERDRFVFKMAKNRRIPILFVVAGGYQSAAQVAELNVNTVKAALEFF